MNRKKIRNDLNQQNRKKEAKPVPREYGDQRRKVKRIASPESGISFAKDVSSSGTNLNKKIEKELARLDQVEKNIRTHKSKVKAICTSTKPQIGANVNQRKLKNVLERMLETIDSSRHKTKKIHATGRKDLDLPATIKKIEKTRRNVLDSIFVESLTNLNKIKKNSIKVETPKKEIVTRKSVLKKPTSAPIPNCNVLADDLRFAENLNFGKGVVRHSTFSAVKKLPSTKNIVQKSDFRVVVEKTSANNLSYVYDSTSLRYVDPASLSSVSASNLFNEPVRTTVLKEGFEKTVETKQIKRQESKPERKKFYSFLRRGNFTISHHDSSNKAKNSEDRDFENKTECRETEKEVEVEDVGIGDIRVVNDDKSIIKKSIPGDIEAIPQSALEEAKPICELKNEEKSSELSVFPTDLLERSILAVEKVLQTIDSMTKELCMRTDIKSRLCFESEQSNSGVLIRDSSIDKLLDALPDKQPVSDIPEKPNKSDGTFSEPNEYQVTKKETPLTQKDEISIEASKIREIEKKALNQKQCESRVKIDENPRVGVICIKPPITHFNESREQFVDVESSDVMISTVSPRKQKELAKQCKKTVAAVEDDMEPLKKALNSLRNRVKAIKNQVPDSGPTFRPGTAPNKFGCIIEKLSRQPRQQNFVNDSFVRKLFSDSYNSSVTSNCESCSSKIFSTSISISSNDSKTNTYRKIRTLRKSSNKISSDYLRHTLGKRRNLRKTVGGKKFNKVSSVRHFGFPEHNFEKCLTLLKKKFKDFESSRRRNVNRNMTSRNGFHLVEDLEKVTPNLKTKTECKPDQLEDDVNISRRKWITNKDRNYKLCFKNEHFNNRSETSLESCSKIDSVEIKKNIFLSKATSSPQLN